MISPTPFIVCKGMLICSDQGYDFQDWLAHIILTLTCSSFDVADDVVRCESCTDEVTVHGDLCNRVGHIPDLFDDKLFLRDLDDGERLFLAEANLDAERVLVVGVLVNAAG